MRRILQLPGTADVLVYTTVGLTIPVLQLTDELRTIVEGAGYSTDRINTLRWPFVGASQRAECCLLMDLNDADAASIMVGLAPVYLSFGSGFGVQLWPYRVDTPRYATAGPNPPGASSQAAAGLRVVHLTDARGLYGIGAGFIGADAGQPIREQPAVVNQTLDLPFHFAGVQNFTEQTRPDTVGTGEKSVVVRYQGQGSILSVAAAASAIGLSGRSTGTYAAFSNGVPSASMQVTNLQPLIPVGEDVRLLNAPVDFPAGPGEDLQALDALVASKGWVAVHMPQWTSAAVAIGTMPLSASTAGGAGYWRDKAFAFLGVNAADNSFRWSDGIVSGSFAALAANAAGGGGYLPTRASMASAYKVQLPPTTLDSSIVWGSAADLLDQMPDGVIPTFQRAEVMVRELTTTPTSIFDYIIQPAALSGGFSIRATSARVVGKRWQYGVIGPNGEEAPPLPSSATPGITMMRMDLSDYAILDPGEGTTDTPINSTEHVGPISSYLDQWFKQGTVQSNARRAATDFYARFTCPCGEALFDGLCVFDQSDWWPGLQYAEWSFARDAIPTTRVWGDFWNPAFGFVSVRKDRYGRWEPDPSRTVVGTGSLTVDTPDTAPARVRGELVHGHLQSYMANVLESTPIRFDSQSGLPVAWLYRVQISHPSTEFYGRLRVGGVFQPEPSNSMEADRQYSQMWVPNLLEVTNRGDDGGGFHGSGTKVVYNPAEGQSRIISQPIQNGIPLPLLSMQTIGGGTVFLLATEGPYEVSCGGSLSDAATVTIDPLAWFTGGLVNG